MLKHKSHFWYNKRQRNGILFLLFLITLVQVYLIYFESTDDVVEVDDDVEIVDFQRQVDSLKLAERDNQTIKIKPFNPSFITDYKGAKLGMSTEQIDRLIAFRAKGNYINSSRQFQRVTLVPDSLLAVISPFFKFPDWIINKQESSRLKARNTVVKSKKSITKLDLNTVSKEELMVVNGIGSVLSERIVKYRVLLNGFMFEDQLNEVYGLSPLVIEQVLQRFSILSKPNIIKLNVNLASFKEILRLPYIDYELTKKIFELKDENAEIQSLEELKNIEDFPLDKFDRIALYLHAE